VTLIGSNISDWNRTHIFSELWSPHAHFCGAWFVLAISLLSVLSLWLIWSGAEQPARSRIAALIQGCLWVSFFPAMLVPNTALADPGREIARKRRRVLSVRPGRGQGREAGHDRPPSAPRRRHAGREEARTMPVRLSREPRLLRAYGTPARTCHPEARAMSERWAQSGAYCLRITGRP